MPELTGINFMKIVGSDQKYILTTAYSEYALEGYEHNVVDYLLKPISFERFQKSVLKGSGAIFFPQERKYPFLCKIFGQRHRIGFQTILYIESIKDYVNIRTENDEFIVLDTLKSMENQLPATFVRIHKSFIVNFG